MARGEILNGITKFVVEECYTCHMAFALTQYFKEQRLADGKELYCPDGHVQRYIDSLESRHKKELERILREKNQLTQSLDYYKKEEQRRTLQLRSAKGRITRLKDVVLLKNGKEKNGQ